MFVIFLGIYIAIEEKYRFLVFVSFSFLLIILMTLHYLHPDLIVPYKNEKIRYFDIITGNITYFFFLFFMLKEILDNYRIDTKKLQQYNQEILQKSKEIKQSNLLIKASEEKFKSISGQFPDVIFLTDIKGNLKYISNASIKMFEYTPDEMIGNHFSKYLHKNYIEKATKSFKHVITHQDEEKELLLIIKTKRDFNLNVELSATVYYENNIVVGTIGVMRDISDRLKAEKEILKLSKVVEQSPATIMITDVHGKIEYVNPNFSEITGYSFDEVIGKNPKILKSDKQDKNFYAIMWKTILSGQEWKGELYNRKKNGEYYWELATIFPFKNENEKITHFIALKQDITERKILMQELIEAKEKAEESDRLKSAFLANMSHEIRTPLNGIIGFSKILSKSEISEEKKQKYSNIINKNADGLLHIINDILDISRIESGQLEIVHVPVKVNQLLQEINELYIQKGILKMKKDITFKVQKLPVELEINTDEYRLRQIFFNLIDNAFKFTETGEIEFGVSSVESNTVNFFVKDSGIGIPKKNQKNIFDRFRQVEAKKKNISGNGLGLAIVKQLTELMNGKISLVSEEGKGSLFNFRLPV